MVAQHGGHRVANGIQEAQGFQRLRAAVDQVADQPQVVLGWIEVDPFQQAFQWLQATLHVTDGIQGHQCKAPGTARLKGVMIASKCWPSSASIWKLPCMLPTSVCISVPLV